MPVICVCPKLTCKCLELIWKILQAFFALPYHLRYFAIWLFLLLPKYSAFLTSYIFPMFLASQFHLSFSDYDHTGRYTLWSISTKQFILLTPALHTTLPDGPHPDILPYGFSDFHTIQPLSFGPGIARPLGLGRGGWTTDWLPQYPRPRFGLTGAFCCFQTSLYYTCIPPAFLVPTSWRKPPNFVGVGRSPLVHLSGCTDLTVAAAFIGVGSPQLRAGLASSQQACFVLGIAFFHADIYMSLLICCC